jgi:transcriptional regulator with XRE-family HTH domain
MKQPELGQKIQELRRKKGLTQEELVDTCKLNVRTLQRIESGEVNPRSYTTKIIFNALDYDRNDNFLNVENPVKIYFETKIIKIYEQIQNLDSMKNSKSFFFNFFLSLGIIWFLCALSIIIFNLNFQEKEILLTLIIPFAFSLFLNFSKNDYSNTVKGKSE